MEAPLARACDLLGRVLRDQRTALLETEVYELLEAAGIAAPRRALWVGEPPEGSLPDGFRALSELGPWVLKIVSPDLMHKSDLGGVAFVYSREELAPRARALYHEVARRAPEARLHGVMISERVENLTGSPAGEVLLSLRRDPAFGVVVVLGLGGLLTEWYGEIGPGRSTAILTPGHLRESLACMSEASPAIGLLFRPSRLHARAPLDLDQTAMQLEALASLFEQAVVEVGVVRRALIEIEVNPLRVTPDGRMVAVDGVGRIAPLVTFATPRPLEKIKPLLNPRTAVVLGASAKGANPGRIILHNLRQAEGLDYGGLFAVHPREDRIESVPCLRSISELPAPVDLAVVAIPAEGARDAIQALAADPPAARSIILIPGGFAETGRGELEREIVDALEASHQRPDGGPVMVGGNCLGIVSKGQYNTFFLPHYKLPFHDAPGDSLVAVSQSGAYLVTLSSNLDGILYPRALISFGNQMDLSVADFLEFFVDDPSVKVLAFYIEGFKPGDGERFVKLARVAKERGKRVVVFKAGKTPLGAKAAASHTASLAGDYSVARALMTDAGALVAETLDLFEDALKILTLLVDRWPSRQPGGPRGRVGVLSNAGFECSTVMDRLYGLEPATLTTETRARLEACLPSIAHPDNPIDTTPMATTAQFVAAAEALLADPFVDAMLVSAIPVTPSLDNLPPSLSGAHTENLYAPGSLAQELIRVFKASGKPVVAAIDSGRLYDELVQVLQRGGIPTYRKIDRGSRALAALFDALG